MDNASLASEHDLAQSLLDILACPACHGPLQLEAKGLSCAKPLCGGTADPWPVVNGIPILIDQNRSIFRIADFESGPQTPKRPLWRQLLSRIWHFRPGLSRNIAANENYRHLQELLESAPEPRLLVLGCGEGGAGMDQLKGNSRISITGLDVRMTEKTSVIGDGMSLPFKDRVFDGVVVQGVLEHIFDPYQVERQIYRVLKNRGLIYCELPFMQPNHGGAYDFIRFTQVGHRRFWRRFDEIDAGACCGPGMALAHSFQQFFRALFPFRLWRVFSDWVLDWSLWWLKYFDLFLANTPAGLDGASAFYFLGRKGTRFVIDRNLPQTYRGAQ
ncbi:MAG: methyltransferase domain-containing protein [Magnetococcales bacterium]|nr:methyltransferase domain-containing protein [Magnetococcales bacterium]